MSKTSTLWGRRGIAALACALAVVPATAAAAGARTSAPEPRLSGSASGTLTAAFGPWAGDPVKFQIDAGGKPDATKGTFKVFHGRGTTGDVVGDFEGKITCLAVGGDVAVATGVITSGYVNLPDTPNKDVTGQKVSFTVQDDGRSDRFYWMWEFLGAPINDCQGTAPMYDPQRGNFKVRG